MPVISEAERTLCVASEFNLLQIWQEIHLKKKEFKIDFKNAFNEITRNIIKIFSKNQSVMVPNYQINYNPKS